MFEMISNVFNNLFSRPATRLFPFVARKTYDNVRGKVGEMRIDDCIYCGICERKCPSYAIKVDKVAKTWTIDRYKCVICSVCADVCPKKCIDMDKEFLFSAYEKSLDVHTGKSEK
jgi:formate hydrogenlyase subunit 6/NADH:ubiquinone oxidoreductase subunit I